MVVRHEAVLNAASVHWAAERLGLTLPPVLAPEPAWRSPDAESARAEAAREELAAEGFLDRDEPGEDFEDSLRLLCRAPAEVSAYVRTEELTYQLHAAAGRRRGRSRATSPGTAGSCCGPPARRPWPGWSSASCPSIRPPGPVSYSVPVADLTGEEPRGQAARVAAIFAQPRCAGGQVFAGVRDHRRHRRSEPVTFVDTGQGRRLSHLSDDGRFVITIGGSDGALLAKLDELKRALG